MLRGTIEQSQRLAAAVRARREERGWTQADVVARGSVSLASVQVVEAGTRTSFQNKTVNGLEQGLGWAPGSVRAVLAGGAPQLLEENPSAEVVSEDFEVLGPDPAQWTPGAVVDTLGTLSRFSPAAFWEGLYNIAAAHRKVTGQDTIDRDEAAAS
ncbi:helix-turn-helix domain-containing protein [Crossiella sp. SN42]|uniref:helix-turn-helix domain-containing protein n=1 Tax=Crossiella sp. SN42 TaxID=2944808 RepID=UPI00207C8074|nr:helix-turn-helix domain-containing protein [Crossiella sp. SN42]MCO1574983.1 helix-turn-helix domain-containing protein [Crossiella sp. SN42]